ncbi:MAG TPA: hypothetical protein VIQ24_24305 [Pyrinomonadaceae bacterium]
MSVKTDCTGFSETRAPNRREIPDAIAKIGEVKFSGGIAAQMITPFTAVRELSLKGKTHDYTPALLIIVNLFVAT